MTNLNHTLSALLALAALTFSGGAVAQDDPLDDLPEAPPSTSDPLERPDDDAGDLLEDPPEEDLPEDPPEVENELPEDMPQVVISEKDPLDELPEADLPDDEFADVPDQAPAPGGALLTIDFTSEISEMRLKGPDGKHYTDGRLMAGRYVLGVRYADGQDWERFTFDLPEGKEMLINCNVTTQQCGVKSRDWKP